MQDIWYADNRDLVKWAALVLLAARERLHGIVQVALFRRGERPTLKTRSGTVEVPESVWTHFRQLRNIRALGGPLGLKIYAIEDIFDPRERQSYFKRVAEILRRKKGLKAVLLDPDTGIKPAKVNAKHVTPDNILETWKALTEGDRLLLYQHRWRNKQWTKFARSRFESAYGVSEVESFRASKRPSDVILLGARK